MQAIVIDRRALSEIVSRLRTPWLNKSEQNTQITNIV